MRTHLKDTDVVMVMNTIPLSEISRPKTLDDIIGQESAVKRLKEYLINPDDTPHMLLSGPPGCGKTSAILAWARCVYGNKVPIHFQDRNVGNSRPVRMMNMSALRGVKDVLTRIHETCQYIHDTSGLKTSRGIVICDEADSLTAESQEVLVYCLRKYSERWIFALVMNYPSRIGERLWKECEHIPFTPLEDILPIVKTTIKGAKLGRRVTQRGMSILTDVYDGDLRRILNAAQGVFHLGEGFVPEWKRWTDIPFRTKTPAGLYKYLKSLCESEGSSEENRIYLGLALAIHRPGSLRPLIAAITEHCD
jgi:DNA polymerase III delta prime subunit